MSKKTNNTIIGKHIKFVQDKDYCYELGKKDYIWHIPKKFRCLEIAQGDYVLVQSCGKIKPVYVCSSFREDIEETGNKYFSVMKKIDWNRKPVKID